VAASKRYRDAGERKRQNRKTFAADERRLTLIQKKLPQMPKVLKIKKLNSKTYRTGLSGSPELAYWFLPDDWLWPI